MWIVNTKTAKTTKGFKKYGIVVNGHDIVKDNYEEAVKCIEQWDIKLLTQFIGFASDGEYDLKPLYLKECENKPKKTELWDKKEAYMSLVGTFESEEEAENKAEELEIEHPIYKGRGGYHGGGRKPTGIKRVSINISGQPEQIERLKQQAAAANMTVSAYIFQLANITRNENK